MKKRMYRLGGLVIVSTLAVWLACGTVTGNVQAADVQEPIFSKESGCYEDGFEVSLSAQEGSKIYYTTDGSIPLAKEDEKANPTPTPVPTEKPKDVTIDVSKSNTDYVYNVDLEEKSDGLQLAFQWRYRSMCFVIPEEYRDWSKYAKITVDYSVVDGHDGERASLQACPVYAGSPDSYGEDGEYRAFEADTHADIGEKHVKWEINLSGKSGLDRDIGYFMLGSTTLNSSQSAPYDTIIVHSVTLSSDNYLGDPNEKEDTKEYTKPISVVNRNGATNVLAAPENVRLTYNTGMMQLYCPKDNEVAKATVIRALAVDAAGNRSQVVTKTYFVGNALSTTYQNASVISVVTDPDNLLDREKGIFRAENYENKGKDWERQAFVEYFEENGTIPFATNMGIRVHGGYSRHYGQKSLNLYFRDEYGGLKNLKNYPLIPGAVNYTTNEQTNKYKSVMLRNGGNDTEFTKLADTWIQGLVKDRKIATQSTRPCVMFLNGEYWGLYNLTEKYSDNYLEEKFGVDKDNVVVIKDGAVDEGEEDDIALYTEMKALGNLDMTKEENYKKFTDSVDVDSFIDYYATEVYIGNYDWPLHNFQLWRTRTSDGSTFGDAKWRWLLFDTEFSMEMYGNSTGTDPLAWVLDEEQDTAVFRAVYKNKDFREKFSTAMCDMMNTNFENNHATTELNRLAAIYKPLMTDYFVRFGLDAASFDSNIARMKQFVSKRPLEMLVSLKTRMDAGSSTELTVKSNQAATISINTTRAELTNGEWKGTYFKKYPVSLTAPEAAGYKFTGWKLTNATAATTMQKNIQVTLGSKPVIEACYEPIVVATPTPIVPTIIPTPTPASPAPSAIPTASPTNRTVKKPGKVKSVILKSKKKKRLTIRFQKVSGASGYQIVYSKNSSMKKCTTIFTKKTQITVQKLKGKKYYVKVRAYMRQKNGKKVYGSYSGVKCKKLK